MLLTLTSGVGQLAYASVDRAGYLWVTNYGDSTITRIATGSKGVITPTVKNFPRFPRFWCGLHSPPGLCEDASGQVDFRP